MFFTSKFLHSTSKPYKKLLLGDCELDYVDDYKYLGVIIDTKLTFTKHLNKTIKTVSYKASQLCKIHNSISAKTALQFYKTMILPMLDFGDLFFHNKSKKLINKLQVIKIVVSKQFLNCQSALVLLTKRENLTY